MNSKYSPLSHVNILLVIASLFIIGCKQDKQLKRTETLRAYEVDVAAESYSAGKLRYMEAEYYEGNRLISKSYYNEDQSLKGKEVYHYTDTDSLPESSIYYGGDDAILAKYTFTNEDGFQVQRDGYDGNTGELLRQERYQYDPKGRKARKILFDATNRLQKTYMIGHDDYGNEKEVTVLDPNDNIIVKEEFEISLIDDDNRWIEKWGYVRGDKYPKTFYKKSY